MTNSLLFGISIFVYFFSMVLYVSYLAFRSESLGKVATWTLFAGVIVETAAIFLRWFESYQMGIGRAPLTTLYNWLIFHVVTCFVGYAAFAVSFGVSFLYLLKVKTETGPKKKGSSLLNFLPSREGLDEVGYKTIAIGFPLLTIGIITGAFWANVAWGTYWSWDSKETWSLIVWLIYAAYLHARITKGWRGNKAALLSIVGFSATLFCYLGVNLILSGLHSYGGAS